MPEEMSQKFMNAWTFQLVKGLVFGGVIAKPASINLVWFTLHRDERKNERSALEDLKNILEHILLVPLYLSDWPSRSLL